MSTNNIIDKTRPYFPVAGLANDGWSTEDEATATCFCGAVQLSFVSFSIHVCPSFESGPLSALH